MPVLKCARCAHTWLPRSEQPPHRCPRCRSELWDGSAPAGVCPCTVLTCARCAHEWQPRVRPAGAGKPCRRCKTGRLVPAPRRCPRCQTWEWLA